MEVETHHIRRTNFDHLAFEESVQVAKQQDSGELQPLQKSIVYRLADELVSAGLVSCQDYRVLKEIIGASGDDHLCSCSNRTLAIRLGFAHVSQVSRAIRRLRDAGFLTVVDSGNCKRGSGFGLSVAILTVRHSELTNVVKFHRNEEKDRVRQQRLYETAKRRILTVIKYNHISEDIAHLLYEAKEMAKAAIDAAATRSSAIFAQAAALIQKAITKALHTLDMTHESVSCDTNLTRVHDKSAMHILITTLNPIGISNKTRQLASANHSNTKAAYSGKEAQNKNSVGSSEGVNREVEESAVSLEMVMAACPSIKPYLQRPVRTWSDLIDESEIMARMCGVNASAVAEGNAVMGKHRFAVAMAIVLHKSLAQDAGKRVNKPGGYVRGMIAKSIAGELRLDRTIFGLLSESASA